MKKIRKTAVLAAMLVSLGIAFSGCEWESSGSGQSWSDAYNWVNFSGVYKNPNGGSVVTDFTTGQITNDANQTVVSIGPVTIENGNGGSVYSGQLLPSVVPGSLQITAGGVVYTDNGSGQLVPSSGLGTMTGSISYDSGAWNINLGGVAVPAGQSITARYSVYQNTAGTANSTTSYSKRRGTTGTTILSFTVMQEGNLLTFIDSDGRTYTGKMGSLRSASGDLGQQPRAGDTVIAQFSVKGVSRAGINVEIVGVFQGTISEGGSTTYIMGSRNMQGQWVEKVSRGKVGDVVGAARDAAIDWQVTQTPYPAP